MACRLHAPRLHKHPEQLSEKFAIRLGAQEAHAVDDHINPAEAIEIALAEWSHIGRGR
jgi:hypothetical protein